MAEKRTLIDGKTITFSGVVDLKEFLYQIDQFFHTRGYNKQEMKNHEQVLDGEREMMIDIMPYRKISDYERIDQRVFMIIKHIKPVEVEIGGVTKQCVTCNIMVSFDCYLVTDYEDKLQMQAGLFFFRTLVDKYIHKGYLSEAEKMAKKDQFDCEQECRAFLGMHKFHAKA
ncbi:MAG: hypothetical protein ABIA93_02930 [Candidatus Woesearchaeota archaeon]